jgi:XTP/dITP diphosphohydrolase
MAMQLKIILATRNKGKVEELIHLLEGLPVSITSLADHPEVPEVVEDGETFRDNARKKAREVTSATGAWTLADDSGLAVKALDGRPGVYSARYAGKNGDHQANNEKLLAEMKDVPDGERQAAFVCAMVLASPDGREWDVEKHCEGEIAFEPKGSGGFGYDPLFFVPQFGRTMAELSMEEKNSISHRGKALRAIKEVLLELLE